MVRRAVGFYTDEEGKVRPITGKARGHFRVKLNANRSLEAKNKPSKKNKENKYKEIIEEAQGKMETGKFSTIFDALMDSAGYDYELFDEAVVAYASEKYGISPKTPHEFWNRYNEWKREAGV